MADNFIDSKALSKPEEYSSVPISTSNPGCIIILVDQSFTMTDPYGDGMKAERAALAVNKVITNLVYACQRGDEIRDRCYVTVVGYGADQIECAVDGMISDVARAYIRIENTKEYISDGAGGVTEISIQQPVWLEPKARGNTPMDRAFQHALEVIERWLPHRPDGFPPVVVNITDGEATRPHVAADNARKIMNMGTSDGACLVFNLHIPDLKQEIRESEKNIAFPHETTRFANDSLAQYLFDISSVLPGPLIKAAQSVGFQVEAGARCFGYNLEESVLISILQFGTIDATDIKALPPGIPALDSTT